MADEQTSGYTPEQTPEQIAAQVSGEIPLGASSSEKEKERPLDLSFTRSQRDMIYVSLIAAFLALGLGIIVFANNLNTSRDSRRTETSLRAEVNERLAIVEDQAQARLEQARQALAAETNQFISRLEGRLQRLEGRIDEIVNLPDEVRASLAREMILDLQKRSRLLAGQLDQPGDQQALQRIQELLGSLSLTPAMQPSPGMQGEPGRQSPLGQQQSAPGRQQEQEQGTI